MEINPTNLFVNQIPDRARLLIFPAIFGWAILNLRTGALAAPKGETSMSPESILNQSSRNLEFWLSKRSGKLIAPSLDIAMADRSWWKLRRDDGLNVEALDGEFEFSKVPLDQAKKTADLATFKTIFIHLSEQFLGNREFICWINMSWMGEI